MKECSHCLNIEPSVKKRPRLGLCCDDCERHIHNRKINLLKKNWVSKAQLEDIIDNNAGDDCGNKQFFEDIKELLL